MSQPLPAEEVPADEASADEASADEVAADEVAADGVFDVIVVGGGLAGLTAAASATSAGARTLVIDRQEPGGRASTDERSGYFLNRGAHALYRSGEAAAVLAHLKITPRGKVPRFESPSILIDDELHPMPVGPPSLASSKILGRRDKLQLAAVLPRITRRPGRHEATLASRTTSDWLASFELRPRVRTIAEAIVHTTSYCADLDRLSADLAALQLAIGIRGGVTYLDGGWRQLVLALADRGGAVVKARAESVTAEGDGFAVETATGRFRARAVVLALESARSSHGLIDGLAGAKDAPEARYEVTASCLDLVSATKPRPDFVFGGDEPLYLSLHSGAADFRSGTDGRGGGLGSGGGAGAGGAEGLHVVHLMRYGARSAAEDRPTLESLALQAGITVEASPTARFLADMTVVSSAPTPAGGGMAGRPGIECFAIPGCYVAGDWVGPKGFLADACFSSGERAGLAAAKWASERGGAPGRTARASAGAAGRTAA